jgi:hypothetical protein
MCPSSLCLFCGVFSRCLFKLLPSYEVYHLGSTLLQYGLFITHLHLQRPNFQIRPQSQVPALRCLLYLFQAHSSTHDICHYSPFLSMAFPLHKNHGCERILTTLAWCSCSFPGAMRIFLVLPPISFQMRDLCWTFHHNISRTYHVHLKYLCLCSLHLCCLQITTTTLPLTSSSSPS